MFPKNETNSELVEKVEILLRDFIVEYEKKKPNDLILFAVNYFETVNEDSILDNLIKKDLKTKSSTLSSLCEKSPRRVGISAEKIDFKSLALKDNGCENEQKSETIFNEIKEACEKVTLFHGLNKEDVNEIIKSMIKKETKSGEIIVEEGQTGDFFYIIGKGIFETYTIKHNEPIALRSYHGEGFFGELALMYNVPRSATVISRTDGVLWALDRHKFKEIVLVKAYKRREDYNVVLKKVELFKNLTEYEICIISDTLVERKYYIGECVIKQGDLAEEMYIIESGEVIVKKTEAGVEKDLTLLRRGEYFGELAMLIKKNRQASVFTTKDTTLLVIDSEGFERLLGPCLEIMKRNVVKYDEVVNQVFGSSL